MGFEELVEGEVLGLALEFGDHEGGAFDGAAVCHLDEEADLADEHDEAEVFAVGGEALVEEFKF